jgi:hypothetical protein
MKQGRMRDMMSRGVISILWLLGRLSSSRGRATNKTAERGFRLLEIERHGRGSTSVVME